MKLVNLNQFLRYENTDTLKVGETILKVRHLLVDPHMAQNQK